MAFADLLSSGRRGVLPEPNPPAEGERGVQDVLADFLREARMGQQGYPWQIRPGNFPSGRALLDAEAPVQVAAVLPEAPPAAPPAQPAETRLRVLDRDEIATLYRRSEQLIGQGDIAGARLLLTRAAEAGDARSALALGATYDAANLGRLGVRGIAPDAAQAQAWYAKAAEFGSSEASRRLEQFAQSVR